MLRTLSAFFILPLGIVSMSCRPAAAPVSISNRPASINDRRTSVPIAEMTWTSSDGTRQRLGSLRGKVVILDFWATYCIPCREEIPHLNGLQAKYGADKLQVLGMHAGGEEDRPKIAEFQQQTAIEYPLAYPDDDLLQFIFANDDRIPQTAVFDKNGNMVRKIVGFDPEIKKQLDSAVESAIGPQ